MKVNSLLLAGAVLCSLTASAKELTLVKDGKPMAEIVLYKEPPKEEKPSDLTKWMPIICAVLPAILAAFVVFRNKRG